jgi:hypothetical protein
MRPSSDGSFVKPEQMGHIMSLPNHARSALKTARGQPSDLSDCERWYAVHTLPFAEARAEGQLRRQGFQTFQPKRLKTVRHARRLSTVEALFFPRYMFMVLNLAHHQWRSVNGTFGVSQLVMRGDQPHPVPHGVVEALIAAADARGILQLGRNLQVGGPVRLMAGPLILGDDRLISSTRLRQRAKACRRVK